MEIDEFEVIGSRGGSDDDEGDLEGNDDDDDDDEDDEDDVRGKGKKKSTSKGKKKGGSGNKKSGWTVEKAGLKDGAVVAYYVKDTQGRSTSSAKGTKPKGFVVERPLDEDEEGEWDEEEDAKMVE